MTSTPHAIGRVAHAPPSPARAGEASSSCPLTPSTTSSRWTDARVFPVMLVIVAGLFLLLENPYWVPGGDSEVYTAIARSLASGNDYRFNGQPARIAPPGWPVLMALVIKFVSPTFLALKLVTLLSMLGAMAIYYWVVRRFTTPLAAGAVVVLTSVISHVYSLTFWLHSDALFTLITAAMVLVALQINEGRGGKWRIAALLGLCVAAAFVRWAGVINVVLLGAVLLQGGAWRRARPWATCALVVLVTFGAFFAVRWGMKRFAPPRVAFEETAQMDLTAITSDVQVIEGFKETQEPAIITGTRGHSGYATRLAGFGTWFSYFLWQPFRLAAGFAPIWWLATAVGWVVAAVVIPAVWRDAWAQRWLLPAVFLYMLALCLNWPHATARYLVPIAPLIVLLIFRGLAILRDASASSSWTRRAVTALGVVGVGSVVLCNLALYAVDVWVMRSENFYDRYEAGLNKSLMAAAQQLEAAGVGHWQTCVNPEYINLNKRRMSPTGLRIVTMLTGKAALQLPRKYTEPPYVLPKDHEFRRQFLGKNKVRYYLEQPKVSPWRVWHFRMGWLQEKLTGQPPADTDAGWRLYVCEGASMPQLVELPPPKYPTRVPGF